MHAGDVFHAWFIFNLHTKISLYLQVMHWDIYRASFFARGDEYLSALVSGLPTTAPPLGFYPSHPFTPYSSDYII
jgi:hypothetical protein